MIGFLLALALVVGCPSAARSHEQLPMVAAICLESVAVAAPYARRAAAFADDLERAPRPMSVRVAHRTRDLRCGGMPQPRAPSLRHGSSSLG